MKCLHCLIEFHPVERKLHIGKDINDDWVILRYDCPACNKMNLYLVSAVIEGTHQGNFRIINTIIKYPIYPKGSTRPPCPSEVPFFIAEDYTEACIVLADSPKASAALSRRCLQNLLREAAKIKPGNLANEIQLVIESLTLPSDLAESIDAIRNIGNFAAHPEKSEITGMILPVEPAEAEWNLDVLEDLFDFYYVRPAIRAKKRSSLNTKLSEAGKPPMK
jgi:hypothetical protein